MFQSKRIDIGPSPGLGNDTRQVDDRRLSWVITGSILPQVMLKSTPSYLLDHTTRLTFLSGICSQPITESTSISTPQFLSCPTLDASGASWLGGTNAGQFFPIRSSRLAASRAPAKSGKLSARLSSYHDKPRLCTVPSQALIRLAAARLFRCCCFKNLTNGARRDGWAPRNFSRDIFVVCSC